jgi:hypothetical protein
LRSIPLEVERVGREFAALALAFGGVSA